MEASREGGDRLIRVAQLVDEPFDRVYVYGPYTGPDEIAMHHGVHGLCASGIDLFVQDRASLLVITSNGRIIRFAEVPTGVALFDPGLSQGVERDDAVLRVRNTESGIRVISRTDGEKAEE